MRELRHHLGTVETHIYPLKMLKKEKKAVEAMIEANASDEAALKAKLIFAVKEALLIHLFR